MSNQFVDIDYRVFICPLVHMLFRVYSYIKNINSYIYIHLFIYIYIYISNLIGKWEHKDFLFITKFRVWSTNMRLDSLFKAFSPGPTNLGTYAFFDSNKFFIEIK